ncbi:ParA family protein [Hamadaea sp. NPDC051192]|uniref:ParA family protein n=1 Tax=Hamadaea sp. NPDC051192 TaxID=3154940 RepID=UPI0034194318
MNVPIPRQQRSSLPRCVCAVNGKGGTGKTSTTANQAALCAAGGMRVLVIDMDPQGNLCTDLGYKQLPEFDGGRAFAAALVGWGELAFMRGVRPNLDVICGGMELLKIVPSLMTMAADQYRFRLLDILQPYAADYDIIFIDTPPGTPALQEIALTTSRYAYIPTRTDVASIDEGVANIAGVFADVRQHTNPDLTLLGVVIVATTFQGEKVRTVVDEESGETRNEVIPATARMRAIRERIELILGEAAPVYRSHVRYVEAAAVDARAGGQLAHELEQEVLSGPSWVEQLRNPELRSHRLASSQSAAGLAGDYQNITTETLHYIREHEERLAGAVA